MLEAHLEAPSSLGPEASDPAAQVGCLQELATCSLSLTLSCLPEGAQTLRPSLTYTQNLMLLSGPKQVSSPEPSSQLLRNLAEALLASAGTWKGPGSGQVGGPEDWSSPSCLLTSRAGTWMVLLSHIMTFHYCS